MTGCYRFDYVSSNVTLTYSFSSLPVVGLLFPGHTSISRVRVCCQSLVFQRRSCGILWHVNLFFSLAASCYLPTRINPTVLLLQVLSCHFSVNFSSSSCSARWALRSYFVTMTTTMIMVMMMLYFHTTYRSSDVEAAEILWSTSLHWRSHINTILIIMRKNEKRI